ncbi:MAG: class I SAM-dependent methyltransferase [Nanoarchaeota archaeon]|nr:class I SAM-dependent methyltransferase [Nanoarchaeota archaeon]
MDYLECIKKHVKKARWRNVSSFWLNLASDSLTDLFEDYVCFEKRIMSEIPFLLSHIDNRNAKILDTCLGSGATTIGLKIAGIENIISNELSESFIRIAQKEAIKQEVSLDIRTWDWRQKGFYESFFEEFDVVLCLGNSLTYLLDEKDRLTALNHFNAVIKPHGKLIIDERNYAHHFLRGDFRYSGEILYCGKDKVSAKPIFVSESMVIMEYEHKHNFKKAHLMLYPFKENEMKEMLVEAGFEDIKVYGDYKKSFRPEEPEFLTYVCQK